MTNTKTSNPTELIIDNHLVGFGLVPDQDLMDNMEMGCQVTPSLDPTNNKTFVPERNETVNYERNKTMATNETVHGQTSNSTGTAQVQIESSNLKLFLALVELERWSKFM